jgi:hypothetical protein
LENAEGRPRSKYEVVVNTVQFLNKSSPNSPEAEKNAAE